MALRIRLRRMGRKKAPTYRLVVAESSMPRDGRFVENLGHYNPRSNPVSLVVDRDRALYWISNGAVPTDTAQALLKKAGVFKPAPEQPDSAVGDAVDAVKGAASRVAAAVKEAADEVRERLGRGDEAAAEAPAAEPAPAAEGGEEDARQG